MPTLVISIDGAVIKEVQLTKERTTLGRRPYNDIVIENLAVSGEHAVLTISGGKVSIEDLRSTNGTYVNGRAIQKQDLLNGDLLDIGRYKIRFLDTVNADSSAPSPAQSSKKALAHISEEADSGYAKVASPSGFGEISSFSSTIQGSLAALPERHAVIRMLTGSLAGREIPLFKVVTTLGKPGVAIASITQKPHGFVLTQLEGASEDLKLNGQVVGPLSVPLLNGDTVDLAGSTMRFVVE
ncbi:MULTISPECIES: FHA domain-containing protein [Comamonas]|uniref:FHA domain-containing protein n=1 Tax=Comamonas thiooxydans TaxID=363952 RepID=UPI000579E503|nr:FHA domain-containing protein [Comamonas thiooxydans]UUE92828.1 FHA domain-containing protein [Comamonas thiooxydans]